jgi:hypothetical protein
VTPAKPRSFRKWKVGDEQNRNLREEQLSIDEGEDKQDLRGRTLRLRFPPLMP